LRIVLTITKGLGLLGGLGGNAQGAQGGAAGLAGGLGNGLGGLLAFPGRTVNGLLGYIPGGGLIQSITGGLFSVVPGGGLLGQFTGLGGGEAAATPAGAAGGDLLSGLFASLVPKAS
jgi:hypothetical protein